MDCIRWLFARRVMAHKPSRGYTNSFIHHYGLDPWLPKDLFYRLVIFLRQRLSWIYTFDFENLSECEK